jgi:hypothetical protein
MKTFLNKKDIDNEIDAKLEQALIINKQAQAYLEDGDMDNAYLFCDIAEKLIDEAGELRELRLMLFSYTPTPTQEYHFIQGNNRVDEMVAVIDLN